MKIKINNIARLKGLSKIIKADHHTAAWKIMGFYVSGTRTTIVCPGEEVACTVIVDDLMDATACPQGHITFGVEVSYLEKMIIAAGLSESSESVLTLIPFETAAGEHHYKAEISVGKMKMKVPMVKASDGAPMPDGMDAFTPGAYTTLEEADLFVGYGKHVWMQAQKYASRFAQGTNVYIGEDGVVLSTGCPSLSSASKLTGLTTRPYPNAGYYVDQTFAPPVVSAMDAAAKVCGISTNEEWVVAKDKDSEGTNDSYSISSLPTEEGFSRVVIFSRGNELPYPSVILHMFFEPKREPLDARERNYPRLEKDAQTFTGLPDGSVTMTVDDFKRLAQVMKLTSSETNSKGVLQQYMDFTFQGGQPVKIKLMGDADSTLAMAEVDVDLLTPCVGDFAPLNFVDGSSKFLAVVKHALMVGADDSGFSLHFQPTPAHTRSSFGFIFMECNSPVYQTTRIAFSGVSF